MATKDILKGTWEEMKGRIKEKWGKVSDDEITESEGNQEKFLGILQKKYGMTKERAKQEFQDFMSRHKGGRV